MNKKIAVVTGARGQTGSYMCELLLKENIKVFGLHRRCSQNVFPNLKNCRNHPNFQLIEGDITDFPSISGIITDLQPNYLFNFAAQSHVHTSFFQPVETFQIDTIGVLNILESIKKFSPLTKLLQMSSSEQFGSSFILKDNKKIQNEETDFKPRSPYAIAKTAAHQLCQIYRDGYNIFATCAICFNNESPRRGEQFVTRKITKWIGQNNKALKNGERVTALTLGNLDSQRDWGHSEDYCEAIWKIINLEKSDNFVICTSKTHSIKEFLDLAFSYTNKSWKDYICIDSKFFRPSEVDYLCGDYTKLHQTTGWTPTRDLNLLVKEMMENDLNNE